MNFFWINFATIVLLCSPLGFEAEAKRGASRKKTTMKNNPQPPMPSRPKKFKEVEIEGYEVIRKCKKINRAILSGKFNPSDLSRFAGWYERFANHPDIEKETNVSRWWFKEVANALEKCHENYLELKNAQEDELKEEFDTAKTEHQNLMRKFKYLAKNPDKLKK